MTTTIGDVDPIIQKGASMRYNLNSNKNTSINITEIKRRHVEAVRKFGERVPATSGYGSKLQGTLQSTFCVVSKRDVNLAKPQANG
ncbi:hypothetical protein AVEN_136637-1 [Araneus ventricosus]|uniref:Uncharacterized protein n=1 Tax=Araneus ventricosus TaxID=182803 RepID=A0A4Y2CB50_ARAVE|nr:hypothetical protein AVEN_136637-1 [Araneus ventricosus]